MFAVIDCNNFFVSCEKAFNPALEGRAVVVLSNNDGCVVSRSQEAKDMGIKMGMPAYQLAEQMGLKGDRSQTEEILCVYDDNNLFLGLAKVDYENDQVKVYKNFY